MRKILMLAAIASCLACVSGCVMRVTGPCLGYGCPALTADGGANAQNRSAHANQANTTAANQRAQAEPDGGH